MRKFKTAILLLILSSTLLLPAKAQTTVEGSFVWDGIERTYRIYIPANYDPAAAVPLLFNLHGYGSNNLEQEVYGDFRPIADTAGFIIAHPNGAVDFTGNRSWNTFGFTSVDDVGFLSALIDTISSSYNIDPERIYSTGMSNGGFMSYDLACFLSDRIAAVASVTGSMILSRFDICDPQHPMPVMQIHGTADATVPYNGNQLFAHIDTLVNYWVNFNNCNPVPEIIEVPDIDPDDGCTAEQHIFSDGENGSSVEFFKVLGGGHSWPGAPVNLNITNMDFSASEEIWRFVSQFTLDGMFTSTQDRLAQSQDFVAFPNPSDGLFTLSFMDNLPKTIMVTNTFGQVIEQHESTNKNLQVNLLQKGIYLITVIQQNGLITTQKVVVR
jgi:polyhydroxybutyrate depolymerase